MWMWSTGLCLLYGRLKEAPARNWVVGGLVTFLASRMEMVRAAVRGSVVSVGVSAGAGGMVRTANVRQGR